MKFRIRFADQVVGFFIILGIAFLGFAIILMGLNQRWFAKNYYYHSMFPTAEGLSTGMAIKLKGFEIGKISAISLTPNNQVNIEFYIYDTFHSKIYDFSILELVSNPLGLGGGMVFHPGIKKTAPLPEYSFIPSKGISEGKLLVQQGKVKMPEGDEVIGAIFSQVDSILYQINKLTTTINLALAGRDKGKIGQILNNIDQTIIDLDKIAKEPADYISKFWAEDSSIAAILDDEQKLIGEIQIAITSLNSSLTEIEKFSQFLSGSTGQLSGLFEDARKALSEGQDVLEGLKNNPLLRGGISEQVKQPDTFQSLRDEDF